MINETSAGIILFRISKRDGIQYLLLYHRGMYFNFPKGKIEKTENAEKAAVRETEEETGIKNIKLAKNWQQDTEFFFKEERNGKQQLIKKKFIMFLAAVNENQEVKISAEHNGYVWADIKTVKKLLKFKNMQDILNEAHSYVKAVIDNAKTKK